MVVFVDCGFDVLLQKHGYLTRVGVFAVAAQHLYILILIFLINEDSSRDQESIDYEIGVDARLGSLFKYCVAS